MRLDAAVGVTGRNCVSSWCFQPTKRSEAYFKAERRVSRRITAWRAEPWVRRACRHTGLAKRSSRRQAPSPCGSRTDQPLGPRHQGWQPRGQQEQTQGFSCIRTGWPDSTRETAAALPPWQSVELERPTGRRATRKDSGASVTCPTPLQEYRCRWVRCRRSGLSILSGHRHNLGRSERLRLTQRVLDVLGFEDTLSHESNPKTLSGPAAGLRGGSFDGRCRRPCDRSSPHGAAVGSAIHARARVDLNGRW